MADSIEPRVQRSLTEKQVTERVKVLVQFIKEKEDIETEKASQTKKWNEQVKLLEEQIHTTSTEIRTKSAWIPRQLALGEDPNAEPVPGATRAPRKKAKVAGGRRRARNADAETSTGEAEA